MMKTAQCGALSRVALRQHTPPSRSARSRVQLSCSPRSLPQRDIGRNRRSDGAQIYVVLAKAAQRRRLVARGASISRLAAQLCTPSLRLS